MSTLKRRTKRLSSNLWARGIVGSIVLICALTIPSGISPMSVHRISPETTGVNPPLAPIRRITLSGRDFRQLWTEALSHLPDLRPHTTKPSITGDAAADTHIQSLAEARGYRLQPTSTAKLVTLDGQLVHPAVRSAWTKMRTEARRGGVDIVNNSGYRSVDRQRQLFLSRFRVAGGSRFSNAQIAAGHADTILDRILSTSSIPGYSRHHTGYTVDIGDRSTGQTFQSFGASPAYRWMSRGNYANIRRFGFIPSYPPGAGQQGPDPEPWEFVWIGDLQIPSYSLEIEK